MRVPVYACYSEGEPHGRFRYGVATLMLASLIACQDSGTAVDPEQSASRAPAEGYATRGPLQTGWILDSGGRPVQVRFEIQHGRAIWQRDIDLGPAESIATTRAEAAHGSGAYGQHYGIGIDYDRWPGGVVPYAIPSAFPDPGRITTAIAHIEANNAGVDFVPRTTESDFVLFQESTGCASAVGRNGGIQYVWLASGCTSPIVVHELLHTLGMMHEQSRCDRDTYVTIQTANIEDDQHHNFDSFCASFTDYFGYSEGSLMHYGPYDFSKNGLPTIVSNRGLDHLMGQRSGMNSADIATIDLMYPPHEQGGGW